jgi:hypothetical protein
VQATGKAYRAVGSEGTENEKVRAC